MRKILPFAIAGGVGLLVLVALVVLLGGGSDGGDGTGETEFTLEGDGAVFTHDISVDAGEAYRVRVEGDGSWEPVFAVTARPDEFVQGFRDNEEFISDLSIISDFDPDDSDGQILDSLFFSDDLDGFVSDSADVEGDLADNIVIDVAFGGEDFAAAYADLALFDVDLTVVVFDDDAGSSDRDGRIVVEKFDEVFDGNEVQDIFTGDLPGDLEDFVSDSDFFS